MLQFWGGRKFLYQADQVLLVVARRWQSRMFLRVAA